MEEQNFVTTTTDSGPVFIKPPIYKCDICGKESTWFYGEFMVTDISHVSQPVLYYPYKMGKRYRICFPCFFKKMGVKP